MASGLRMFLVALVALGLAPAAQAATITSTLGPLKEITVGTDASCQASYGTLSFEFYPPDTQPGDCGALIAADGELYAPDFEGHGRSATDSLGDWTFFDPVSQSAVLGSGSAAEPFVVNTVVNLPGAGLELTKTVSYRVGSTAFRVDLSVRNLRDEARSARLFWAGDCYASGSDIGYGFTRSEVRSVGCSQNPDNSPAARTIQLSPQSAGSRFMEARYDEIWTYIGTQQPLPDTCRCAESIDNGVALSWDLQLAPGAAQTRSLSVSFTESAQPAPLTDTDGDALPDAWETGAGPALDYENLAPLGADPNRKDIFVHADSMEGCAPPAGWERKAIALFATHGVALHVDSGPGSINADGSAWGTRSRAGSVPATAVLPMSDWRTFDTYKDQHFVASNRRRAFHYVLFADKYVSGGAEYDGGLSRGAPDSDLLMANCHFAIGRGDTAIFVHELGHNLGLLHGGADHTNNKPNYYSIMNYSYATQAIKDGTLPDYSTSVRTVLDENSIAERDTYVTPIAWYCPGTATPRQVKTVGTRSDLDFDCDGKTREKRYGADLTGLPSVFGDGVKTLLTGHNDWAPGVIKYTGGVIGAFELPVRQDPPIVPELTSAQVQAAATAAATSLARQQLRLLVRTTPRTVRRGRRAVRATVLAGGKPVRRAIVRVRGARFRGGRKIAVTDKRGRVTLRLVVTARKEVTVSATRKGKLKGSVVLPVGGKG